MTYTAFSNTIRFNPVSGGTADFVVASAASGCTTPEQAAATDGKTYHYYAQSADGSVWEDGFGPYTFASHTQARTTVRQNSNGDTNPVNFASPPIVDVFPSPRTLLEDIIIPAGTLMLFQQTSAPTGWTKQTTHNDKALRVVSGTASFGGTNSFSSMMAARTSDATTLSVAQMPAHGHPYVDDRINGFSTGGHAAIAVGGDYEADLTGSTTSNTGGGGSHTHTYDMRIQYVDLIIAQKN